MGERCLRPRVDCHALPTADNKYNILNTICQVLQKLNAEPVHPARCRFVDLRREAKVRQPYVRGMRKAGVGCGLDADQLGIEVSVVAAAMPVKSDRCHCGFPLVLYARRTLDVVLESYVTDILC